MSQQPAIEVQGLVKRFRREILQQTYTTWKSLLLNPFKRKQKKDFITVLSGVDLSVDPGMTLAVIGQNGSGKSTLLKILAGIYKADEGLVKVRGRLASLIELGAGFHPEFSGRENVFLNGAILGLSKKEIIERFDDIAAYSGLGEYIDAPVRTYSSGMYVRLGFSVAVNVDPDVLLVDEVLAVGDEAFANKCEDKINQFRRRGKTIVLVTHDLEAVKKYADEVIWLDGGQVAAQGPAMQVIDAYRQKVAQEEDSIRRAQAHMPSMVLDQERWGDGDAEITAWRILDSAGNERAVFNSGDAFTVELDYKANGPLPDLVCGVGIFNAQSMLCYGSNTKIDRQVYKDPPALGTLRFAADRLDLVQGTYFLDIAIHDKDGRDIDYIRQAASFAMRSATTDEGVFRPPHTWSLRPLEESK